MPALADPIAPFVPRRLQRRLVCCTLLLLLLSATRFTVYWKPSVLGCETVREEASIISRRQRRLQTPVLIQLILIYSVKIPIAPGLRYPKKLETSTTYQSLCDTNEETRLSPAKDLNCLLVTAQVSHTPVPAAHVMKSQAVV